MGKEAEEGKAIGPETGVMAQLALLQGRGAPGTLLWWALPGSRGGGLAFSVGLSICPWNPLSAYPVMPEKLPAWEGSDVGVMGEDGW